MAKPQGAGWWYSNKLIKNVNLMFLDLASYKQKVSWGDSVITTQDTIIAHQESELTIQKKSVITAQSFEAQSKFKADFYEKFAEKQQNITFQVLQKQNRNNLIIGVVAGVLITLLITK